MKLDAQKKFTSLFSTRGELPSFVDDERVPALYGFSCLLRFLLLLAITRVRSSDHGLAR